MLPIHEIALYLHITVGACALLLFWIPVFARKGNLNHKRFGRYFAWCMYTVSASGIIMSSLDLLFPLSMHATGLELGPEEEADAIRQIREFGLFLFSLSILVLSSTRHGWLAMLHKEDRGPLRQPANLALNGVLVITGIVLLVVGINTGTILFMIFGGLEIGAGVSHLKYIYREEIRPKEWWIEHLNGLIGSGIGAYTAFTVFGGRRLFEEIFSSNFQNLSVLLWIGPAVIGTVAITLLSRQYKQRFGGAWLNQRARIRSTLFNSQNP